MANCMANTRMNSMNYGINGNMNVTNKNMGCNMNAARNNNVMGNNTMGNNAMNNNVMNNNVMSDNGICNNSNNKHDDVIKKRPTSPVDRKLLMMEIYKFGFMVNDLTLYLDTHPDDKKALECFNEASNSYMEALKEYTKQFGPLKVSMHESESQWCWNKGPMPWQGEV